MNRSSGDIGLVQALRLVALYSMSFGDVPKSILTCLYPNAILSGSIVGFSNIPKSQTTAILAVSAFH